MSRRPASLVAALLALGLAASACASRSGTTPGSSHSPSGSPQSVAQLKLDVLDAVGGHLAYCDPDLYPVAHGTSVENAEARFPAIEQDAAAFQAILAHQHLTAGQSFTPQQLIAINDLFKQMQAIRLQPQGSGHAFSLLVPQAGAGSGTERVDGTVTSTGQVDIRSRTPGSRIACPICLARGVLIDTPSGPVPIQDVTVGMRVWSTDHRGRRIEAVVLATGSSAAPIGHEVVRLSLADGRTVTASPGHPTADGRTVGALRSGERFDGSVVRSAELIPYAGTATFDLLPSGPTGTYFAGGILLASTLAR